MYCGKPIFPQIYLQRKQWPQQMRKPARRHHRALDIAEILRNIFGQLDASHVDHDSRTGVNYGLPMLSVRDKQDQATLAAAALVCKAFVEPACSLLWRDLPSLLPLFRLLSSLEIVQRHRRYSSDVIVFYREFVSAYFMSSSSYLI